MHKYSEKWLEVGKQLRKEFWLKIVKAILSLFVEVGIVLMVGFQIGWEFAPLAFFCMWFIGIETGKGSE